jgi:hypothetical protein
VLRRFPSDCVEYISQLSTRPLVVCVGNYLIGLAAW